MNKKAKIATITLIVFSLAITIAIFVTIYSRAGMKQVEIAVVPQDATITAPFGEYKKGTAYMPYGEHTVTVSREGFKSIEQTIIISDSTSVLPLSTVPENEIGEQYLEDNPDEQFYYETLGGTQSQKINSEINDRYPFIQQLPTVNMDDGYSLHYGVDESSKDQVYFIIGTSSTKGRKNAIDWFKSQGVDISRADIRYGDFTSPLVSEKTVEGFNQ